MLYQTGSSIAKETRGTEEDPGMWGPLNVAILEVLGHPFPYTLSHHLGEKRVMRRKLRDRASYLLAISVIALD
jgi:hypothetical protein